MIPNCDAIRPADDVISVNGTNGSQAVQLYLAHTAHGKSLRALARDVGLHPSTVLRRVRRIEDAREDPLLDEVLSDCLEVSKSDSLFEGARELNSDNIADIGDIAQPPSTEELLILRRLCENGAFLAIAGNLQRGAVLRGAGKAEPTRTAVVDRDVAKVMVLRDWINCTKKGKVNIYQVTEGGRSALRAHVQGSEPKPINGKRFIEATARKDSPDAARDHMDEGEVGDKPRVNLRESPLTILGRKKERNGKPFLSLELVQAGERLREDFELTQIGLHEVEDWDQIIATIATSDTISPADAQSDNPNKRLKAAFHDLGPGLSDIAFRCCCYLEGLEAAEKRMGWSARSGKIVLRIALQRLSLHYKQQGGLMRKIG